MRMCIWLKRFRKRHSILSQRQFAERIGSDSGNYCKYELGRLIPPDNILVSACNELRLGEVELELLRALASCDRFLCLAIKEDEADHDKAD